MIFDSSHEYITLKEENKDSPLGQNIYKTWQRQQTIVQNIKILNRKK